jgi:ADP-ribose pyrophosphatase YjhB (NUDIX family)
VSTGGSRSQRVLVAADGGREFACFPAAILAFIVNNADEILLLSHPRKTGWQVVAGAIENSESPRAALLREVAEEIGPDVCIRPVASVHTFLYRYDAAVQAMLSIAYVATYISGKIVPGSDMATSTVRWASSKEIASEKLVLVVPTQRWIFQRALAVHRLFCNESVDLEPWDDAGRPPPVTTS